MFGCALLKVLLREPLTCLELETAWPLEKRRPEAFSWHYKTRQAFVRLRKIFSPNMENWKESDASTRCMDENNYDRERCSSYFLKYKNCRRFWNSIMIQRRRNGVTPPMPTAAERDEILGAMGKMPY